MIGAERSVDAVNVTMGAVLRGDEPTSVTPVGAVGPVLSIRTEIGPVAVPMLPSASLGTTV